MTDNIFLNQLTQQNTVAARACAMEPTPTIPTSSNDCGFSRYDMTRPTVAAPNERERLDSLLGQALVDPGIYRRLIDDHDSSLFPVFGLSQQTQAWLSSAHVSTLQELAQAIVASSESGSAAHTTVRLWEW